MIRNKSLRRASAIALVIAGGVIMWLSPQTLAGAAVLGLGIVLEAIGIGLERRVAESAKKKGGR